MSFSGLFIIIGCQKVFSSLSLVCWFGAELASTDRKQKKWIVRSTPTKRATQNTTAEQDERLRDRAKARGTKGSRNSDGKQERRRKRSSACVREREIER